MLEGVIQEADDHRDQDHPLKPAKCEARSNDNPGIPPTPNDTSNYQPPSPQSSEHEEINQGGQKNLHTKPALTEEHDFIDQQRKRKREEQEEEEQPRIGRPRTSEHQEAVNSDDPVAHWIYNDQRWPDMSKRAAATTSEQSESKSNKKSSKDCKTSPSGTSSGSSSTKWWGPDHFVGLEQAKVFIVEQPLEALHEDDQTLCKSVLKADREPPDWRYRADTIEFMVSEVQWRCEAMVRKTIEHLIMPSPRVLYSPDYKQYKPEFEFVADTADSQWGRCRPIYGPFPKPDVCYGLLAKAFTHHEEAELATMDTCTTERLKFPFYICEAKCYELPLEQAEHQSMHAASIACQTMIKLYQTRSKADELDKRVVAFSVSYNHKAVRIFAHFALVKKQGEDVSYHRCKLFEADLTRDVSAQLRPYNIAFGILKHFVPIHLKRIKDVLALPRTTVVEPANDDDVNGEADGADAAAELQKDEVDAQVAIKLAQEKEMMMTLLEEQKKQFERQLADQREEARQHGELMERQLAEQREEARQHGELMQRQLAEQTDEARQLRELMERQLVEQKEEARRRDEQAREDSVRRDKMFMDMMMSKFKG